MITDRVPKKPKIELESPGASKKGQKMANYKFILIKQIKIIIEREKITIIAGKGCEVKQNERKTASFYADSAE